MSARIYLPTDLIHANQHAIDDFRKLVDDDPATIYTVWNPPVRPYQIIYDLADFSTWKLHQLKIYINNGNPSQLKFYILRKDTKAKTLVCSFPGGSWDPNNVLRTLDVPANLQLDASAFIIENEGGNDFPAYMQLFGEAVSSPAALPAIQRSPLSELLGVVVKPWDVDYKSYPEKRTCFNSLNAKRVRFYSDYVTNHQPDGSWAFGFNQKNSLQLLKQDGIEVQFCYLSVPAHYYPPAGGARKDPGSYQLLAKDVYDVGKASLDNGDLFRIFELLNERNAWYDPNPEQYFDGYALAAMCSICYDGHKGMYPNVGLKATGNTAMFSVGGLAEAEPYLLYQMLEWSLTNRGRRADGSVDLPMDIYSFHLYNSLGGQYAFSNPGGVPPEIGSRPYLKHVNKVRKLYAKNTRIHIGEWSGGDINQESNLSATIFGNYTAHQVSAMWTVRCMFEFAENEINADSYYRICQDWPDYVYDTSPVQFATMALVRQENGGTQQPDGSWTGMGLHRVMTGDYFRQIAEFFGNGFVFDSRVSDSPNVLKFKKDGKELYIIWESEIMNVDLSVYGQRPQFTERTGTYTLNVQGKLRRFVDDGSGVMTTENFAGGAIHYSSKPVLVLVDGTPIPPDPGTKKTVKALIDVDPATGNKTYWNLLDDHTWNNEPIATKSSVSMVVQDAGEKQIKV